MITIELSTFFLAVALLSLVPVLIAAIALRKPENRKRAWPWIVGGVGIVNFVSGLAGFILDPDIAGYEIAEQTDGITAAIERLLPALGILGVAQGVALLIVGIVALRKPENRGKRWPWVIGVLGLALFVSNIIGLLSL